MTHHQNPPKNTKMGERELWHFARLTLKRLDKQAEDLNSSAYELQRQCLADPDFTCGLASCPLCRARFQTSFVEEVLSVLPGGESSTWVTITPLNWRTSFDQISKFSVKNEKRWLGRTMNRTLPEDAGLIGVVDFSVNTHENADVHWQPHVHAFVTGELSKAKRAALRRALRPDGAPRHRAVRFETVPVDELVETATYTYKVSFKRRSTFTPKEPAPSAKNSKSLSGPPQRLKAAEDVELQLALQSYRVYDLLFLKGWKRKRTSDPTALNLMKTPNS